MLVEQAQYGQELLYMDTESAERIVRKCVFFIFYFFLCLLYILMFIVYFLCLL